MLVKIKEEFKSDPGFYAKCFMIGGLVTAVMALYVYQSMN